MDDGFSFLGDVFIGVGQGVGICVKYFFKLKIILNYVFDFKILSKF